MIAFNLRFRSWYSKCWVFSIRFYGLYGVKRAMPHEKLSLSWPTCLDECKATSETTRTMTTLNPKPRGCGRCFIRIASRAYVIQGCITAFALRQEYGGFPKLGDTFLGVPINKIYSIWGSIWGVPLFRETTIWAITSLSSGFWSLEQGLVRFAL